ncbi:MAG TPA: transcriptional regulator [Rectinemataceae bacterium]|nr:transcriptional regulator [Rectinemataceae bacterium]
MSDWYANMAQEDFARARTRELLSRIADLLDPERGRLLPLEEVLAILKPGSETYVGMKAVPVDLIVGSEGRYRDFNRHFLPRREHLRSRWVRVDMAHYQDVPLPAVRLYEIGGLYFVRDGNHRVSVARLRGQGSIDAEVTSLDAIVPLSPGMTLEALKRAVLEYEKSRFYEKTEFGKLTGDDGLSFSTPGRYDEILEHILVHKYFVNQDLARELSFAEAVWSWHENVYRPVITAIEEEGLLSRFPGRTLSDLYVFIVKHWDELKRKYGLGYPIGEAARDFGSRFGKTPGARIREALAKHCSSLLKSLGIRRSPGA